MLEQIIERTKELSSSEIGSIFNLLGMRGVKVSRDRITCLCPYHNDTKPSFSMTLQHHKKGLFNCFSCGSHGNLWTLLKDFSDDPYGLLGIEKGKTKNYDHNALFNKSLRTVKKKEIKKSPDPEPDIELYNQITARKLDPYSIRVCEEYCLSRNITREDIDTYNMFYIDHGYIGVSEFKERLVIPIKDETGRVVSVEGRDVTRKETKYKCIYPKGSKIGNTIFNYNNLDPKKLIIFVEGVMDVLAVQKAIPHVQVSTYFGIELSATQKNIIKEFEEVILLLDSDDGGKRGIILFDKNYGKDFHLAFLKDGDPDDATEDEIREAIENKQVNTNYFLNQNGFFRKKEITW